jgi:hypothetical protein
MAHGGDELAIYRFGQLPKSPDTIFSNRGIIIWLKTQSASSDPVASENSAITINQHERDMPRYRLRDSSERRMPNRFITPLNLGP